jgi:hypothetical protein
MIISTIVYIVYEKKYVSYREKFNKKYCFIFGTYKKLAYYQNIYIFS